MSKKERNILVNLLIIMGGIGLFKAYAEILDNPSKLSGEPYIMNRDVYMNSCHGEEERRINRYK